MSSNFNDGGFINKMRLFFKSRRNLRILGGLGICIGLILLFNVINDDVNPEDVVTGKNLRGKGIKVGIVLSGKGKGDKSFNDSAIEGLERAKRELGITYKDIELKENSENIDALAFLAQQDFDLVIGVGFSIVDVLKETAIKYPNVKFALVDASYPDGEVPNNVGLVFKDNEGSYLAGVLAAEMSKTKKVGFIGGMESPVIQGFEGGFTAGAKSVKGTEVYTGYVASNPSGFTDLDKGRELTLDFISRGVDVVYHAAGATGQGVFDAAASKGIKAIGVDSNQNYVKPGVILASMLKCVDVAVYEVCEDVVDKKFEGGITKTFGLADGGVGLTDLYNLTIEETEGVSKEDEEKIKALKDSIPVEIKRKIEKVKEDIISGKIVVPNWKIEGKHE